MKITLGGLLAVASLSAGCGDGTDDVSGSESELRKGQLADGGSCDCAATGAVEDGGTRASHGGKHSGKGHGHHNASSVDDSDGGAPEEKGKGKGASATADCVCDGSGGGANHGKSGDHAHDQSDAGTHGNSGDHAHVQDDAGTHGNSGAHTTK
ncbi:MAG: hypothetical protein JWN04_3874 [Myxococcaceae bacterium]|nr:hypothetical protein [Myxococcaceae bacterium]